MMLGMMMLASSSVLAGKIVTRLSLTMGGANRVTSLGDGSAILEYTGDPNLYYMVNGSLPTSFAAGYAGAGVILGLGDGSALLDFGSIGDNKLYRTAHGEMPVNIGAGYTGGRMVSVGNGAVLIDFPGSSDNNIYRTVNGSTPVVIAPGYAGGRIVSLGNGTALLDYASGDPRLYWISDGLPVSLGGGWAGAEITSMGAGKALLVFSGDSSLYMTSNGSVPVNIGPGWAGALRTVGLGNGSALIEYSGDGRLYWTNGGMPTSIVGSAGYTGANRITSLGDGSALLEFMGDAWIYWTNGTTIEKFGFGLANGTRMTSLGDGTAIMEWSPELYYISDQPTDLELQYGSGITIDGNLSDWDQANWVNLDQDYSNAAGSDLLEASYAVKWGDNGNKIYVAVKVRDQNHVFTNTYVDWNAQDDVEIYLHTTGGPTVYYPNCEAAQQYTVGINTSGTDVWAVLGNSMMYPYMYSVPAGAEYCVAKGHAEGEWLYYEVTLTPYEFLGVVNSTPSIISSLAAGDVIGFDVVVGGKNGSAGDFGMKSANLMTGKAGNYTTFQSYKLSAAPAIPGDANIDGMVDVGDLGILAANYGGSGKTWTQGDFNGDTFVDVGDLGILAAHYGEGVPNLATVDFNADYAKAFGTTVTDDQTQTTDASSSICSALGLPLVGGLMLTSLMLLGGMKFKE
jgi:hypothetical protein